MVAYSPSRHEFSQQSCISTPVSTPPMTEQPVLDIRPNALLAMDMGDEVFPKTYETSANQRNDRGSFLIRRQTRRWSNRSSFPFPSGFLKKNAGIEKNFLGNGSSLA